MRILYGVLVLFCVTFYQNCSPHHLSQSSSNVASVTAFSLSCSTVDPRVPEANQLATLNRFEVENTLVDLFDPYLDTAQKTQFLSLIRPLVNSIPKNTTDTGMDLANTDVTPIHVERHFLLAEAVADYISTQAAVMNRLLGTCSSTRTTESCQLGFIDRFGERALRRTVDVDSRNFYLQLMKDHQDSYRNVMAAMIASPFFYYHNQFGDVATSANSGTLELDAFERANKLSYFLLQSMPDEELFQAAKNGSIMTPQGMLAQVERLLLTPKVRQRLTRFFANQWLHLDETAELRLDIREVRTRLTELNNPDPAALRASLIEEVYDYFDYLIWEERADYAKLMSSQLIFPRTPALASIYGSSQWNGQYDPQSLMRAPASERSGILTRAQFLYTGSGSTRPIMRGIHVYREFMCQSLELPPDNSTPDGVVIDNEMTDQEIVRATTEVRGTSCVMCHLNVINPLGFSFDNFDSFGQFRNSERVFHPEGSAQQGQVLTVKPVRSTNPINISPFLSSEVQGATDLSNKLAHSPDALACFSSKLWNFAQKTNLKVDENPCAVKSVFESIGSEGGSILNAIKTIATQPEFIKRRVK